METATAPAVPCLTETETVFPIVLTLILSAVQTEEEPAVEVPAHVIPIQHQIAGPINVSKVNKAGNSRLVFLYSERQLFCPAGMKQIKFRQVSSRTDFQQPQQRMKQMIMGI